MYLPCFNLFFAQSSLFTLDILYYRNPSHSTGGKATLYNNVILYNIVFPSHGHANPTKYFVIKLLSCSCFKFVVTGGGTVIGSAVDRSHIYILVKCTIVLSFLSQKYLTYFLIV